MNNFDILVNKDNKLPFNYIPKKLVDIPITHEFMTNEKLLLEVYREFVLLQDYANKNGLNIYVNSGYRSYEDQIKILAYYLLKEGFAATKKRVALPGASEHQTGLALDVGIIENNTIKDITRDESIWLSRNASQYGFILRYPEGKEKITGFNYEPWHFRYVGIDLAEYIYKKGLTLEEYHENNPYNKKLKK